MAYDTSNRLLYQFDAYGTQQWLIDLPYPEKYYHPVWSPDGDQFALIWQHINGRQLILMSPDGELLSIIDEVQAIGDIAWALDGRNIIYAGKQTHPVVYSIHSISVHDDSTQVISGTLARVFQEKRMPLVLEIVAGLSQYVAIHGDMDYAVALLSLAINHSASGADTKAFATLILTELEAELPSDIFTEAVEHGKTLNLDAVVEDLMQHPAIVINGEKPPSTQALIDPLTDRELDVLPLMVQGMTYQPMADTLFLAKGTVKTHVHNIYGKLGVENRAQAIHKAQELGLA